MPGFEALPQYAKERVRETSAGCWEWTGNMWWHGYGRVRLVNEPRYAHRYVWAHLIGEVPEGLELDHLCRNRRCVNPTHLEAVTRRENLRRGNTFVARQTSQTHCKRGHLLEGPNLYIPPNQPEERHCRACIKLAHRIRKLERRMSLAGVL